ncbi:Alanyl-tRNA synthetase [Hordeum vulgare]|nr:Alanyl-tRNA synthetase [Hordeum vulgare]
MRPSELQFDKLQIWARVLNLPFNLRSDVRGKAMARQIDENASVQLDPFGGYLRARVTIDVRKPLRRWILIDSAARGSRDWRFWSSAPDWLDIKRTELHPLTWPRDILCDPRFLDAERAKLVTVMWAIWTSRNNATHDKGELDPVLSMQKTCEALAALELPRDHAGILHGHGWRLSDDGWIKINTDGNISMEARRGGDGGVARTRSSFLAAWCKSYPGITDPLIAEALPLRDGVLFMHLRGYVEVGFATDNLEIVNLWNSRHSDRTMGAPILFEIGEHVHFFKPVVIQHVGRSVNVPAHICAKQASTLDVTDSWLDSTPSLLVTSLSADYAGAVCVE